MPQNKNITAELLKFPIMAASIVLALLFAKWLLGIDFSGIAEIGPTGIKFQETQIATSEAMTDLDSRLREAFARIEQLEKNADVTPAETEAVTEETAQVSDAVARLSRISQMESQTLLKGKEGYIWIGDWDRHTKVWSKQQLLRIDTGQPEERAPSLMTPGSKYIVSGNMVLRQGQPPNNAQYFRAVSSLGNIPKGTQIQLLETPTGIDREFAFQCWVKVLVVE